MPPRSTNSPPQRIPIAELPPGKGRILPHNGYGAPECEAAEAKGYVVVDVRWEQGQRRVDLIGQGLIIGSVVLNDGQMTAYEAEVRLYKESRPVEKAPTALTESIMDRLSDIRPGKLAAILQGAPDKQPPRAPGIVKKLTEPTGEAEKSIADEVRKLMEESR